MSSIYYISPNDLLGLVLRLCVALIVGAIIGLERQLRNKPAGLRTHMLVSLGSALFVLIPLQIGITPDPDALSRVIQGIAAGVGFLGAGEILRASGDRSNGELAEIRGLTSAAAVWVSAALGVVAGCGLWQLGLIGAIFALVVLSLFKQVERRI